MDTTNNIQNNTEETVNATFVCNIEGMPIANAGEATKPTQLVEVKFKAATVTMQKQTEETKKNGRKTWIQIHVEGLSIPIFRNAKQAGADLSAYLDADTVSAFSATDLESAYNLYLEGKTFMANLAVSRKDSTYIVDENSTEFLESRAQIGEILNVQNDTVRIDGFFNIVKTREENREIVERAIARAQQQKTNVLNGSSYAVGG